MDTGDYDEITEDMLNAIDPSMTWVDNGDDLVSTIPPGIMAGVEASADDDTLAFFCESASVAARSAGGSWYDVQVDTVDLSKTGYVKVKVIDGSADLGW